MHVAASLVLSGSLEDVGRARRLASTLDDAPAEVRDDVALVISELTANALLHGTPPVLVRLLEGDGCVRVEVRDAGSALPVRPRHNPEAMTGRGFALVASVASRWGVEPDPRDGKTVWAELCPAGQREPGPDDSGALLGQGAGADVPDGSGPQ